MWHNVRFVHSFSDVFKVSPDSLLVLADDQNSIESSTGNTTELVQTTVKELQKDVIPAVASSVGGLAGIGAIASVAAFIIKKMGQCESKVFLLWNSTF